MKGGAFNSIFKDGLATEFQPCPTPLAQDFVQTGLCEGESLG